MICMDLFMEYNFFKIGLKPKMISKPTTVLVKINLKEEGIFENSTHLDNADSFLVKKKGNESVYYIGEGRVKCAVRLS